MSTETLKECKQEILRLSKKRRELVARFFAKEKLIRGSYMQARMRCSSLGCHCHKDGGHPTVRISHWQDGKLRSNVVRLDDRDWVAKASENYKAHKQALRDISKLNKREKEILQRIIEHKAQLYQ